MTAAVFPLAHAPAEEPLARHRASVFLLLSAIILGGVCLRIYNISYLSLWNDEAFSRYYYQTGLQFMWTTGLRNESSPPLYYMALGAWIEFFGSSETTLRSLSVVSSSLAIPLVYGLGKELLGYKRALVAAALFATSATQIYYAQEARAYALLLIPVLATLIACSRYLRMPGRPQALFIYIAATTAAIYTHTTMFLFVAACGLSTLVCAWQLDRNSRKQTALRWIIANFCVAMLALPVLIGMANPMQLRLLTWIPAINWRDIGAVVSNTVVGTLSPSRFPGAVLAVAVACVVIVAVWRDPPPLRAAAIGLVIPGLYAALVLLVSVTLQPIFLSRIFCWVGIPLCLVEAQALAARGWLRPIAAIVITAATGVGLFYQINANANAKEPWRDTLQFVAPQLKQADLVVLAPNTDPAPVMYYAPVLPRVAMWTNQPMSAADIGVMPRLFVIAGITRDEIVRRIESASRVVIIARATDEHRLPKLLEHAGSPASRVDRPCVGGDGRPTSYPCGITVLVWGPERAIAEEYRPLAPAAIGSEPAMTGDRAPDSGL